MAEGPLLIFVHGGAFTEGSRHRSTEIYANVLYYFARHGVVGINVGYRLAPEAQYPEATNDIAKVVELGKGQCHPAQRRPEAHIPHGTLGRWRTRGELRLRQDGFNLPVATVLPAF